MPNRIRPRDAASLILLKPDGPDGVVLMGRRPAASTFIPDAFVFPGGRLDPPDRQIQSPFSLARETLRAMQGTVLGQDALSQALAYTAIRETYEETGLILGREAPFTAPAQGTWGQLADQGLAPDSSRLHLLARAITPVISPVRYHARFFVAQGERAIGTAASSDELLDLAWYPIAEALKLPIIDVTEIVLGHAREVLHSGELERGQQPRTTTFVRYRGEQKMVTRETASES